MKKMCLLLSFPLLTSYIAFSQANCSNPFQVNICPSIYLSNQTNAGMGDDAPSSCNFFGEDLVYEINTQHGARTVYISITNSTSILRLSVLSTSCNSGTANTRIVSAGNSNSYFAVQNVSQCYLWIDAPINVTFDISIGADTGQTWISTPNTQGTLSFDTTCTTNLFNRNKPFFEVTYNNVFQTNPMTLSPLSVTGSMCITTFLKNQTGVEGIKKFEFEFNPAGYSNVNGLLVIPGNYVAGNWIASATGSKWTYTFSDNAGTFRGDYSGNPDTCLVYKFCFNVFPITNDSLLTDVHVRLYTDGFGYGYTGWISQGCCPSTNINCLLGTSSGQGVNSFGYGFTDPGTGSPLPIELIYFKAKVFERHVYLNWSTASEVNNEFFTIEKSINGVEWNEVNKVGGSGNSSITNYYKFLDKNPYPGTSYYRLKQIDFDGNFSYSEIQSVSISQSGFMIYPNPAYESLTIEGIDLSNCQYFILNSMGGNVKTESIIKGNKIFINTSLLSSGIYFMIVLNDGIAVAKEKVIIR